MNNTLHIALLALLALVEALVLAVAVPLIVAAAVAYALLVCARAARMGMQEVPSAGQPPALRPAVDTR